MLTKSGEEEKNEQMSLSPSGPKELLEYAIRLCSENNQRMGKIATADDARRVAEGIVSRASVGGVEPVGVAFLRQQTTSSPSASGIHFTPQRREESLTRDDPKRRAVDANDSLPSLKRRGPPTRAVDCPYCTEPDRRFCPESGRRHETAEEKSQRLWRTMFRYVQFSCRVACVERLEKLNTCSEEFYIEL